METKTATLIFEALTSESRLSIFRLLVKYAPNGLVAGEIAEILNIPKTNLSFHLKTIVYSELVSMEREGRNIRYKANIPLMLETIDYLTAECCTACPEEYQKQQLPEHDLKHSLKQEPEQCIEQCTGIKHLKNNATTTPQLCLPTITIKKL